MASGIPLTHLKDPFIKIFYTFNNNIITYTLSNGLQFQQYSLLKPNAIATSIKNLNKNILSSIHAYKINYIAKNIFNFSITTKHIISIYSLIAKSKITFNISITIILISISY
ncbi:hypothetical protein [Borrelia hermsii]|nr:hypothetical protein [Borrelia hermsii]